MNNKEEVFLSEDVEHKSSIKSMYTEDDMDEINIEKNIYSNGNMDDAEKDEDICIDNEISKKLNNYIYDDEDISDDDLRKKFISNQDEISYIRAAKLGDISAINYIFKKYQQIIFHRLGTYFMKGTETEDMIQEGYIGLYQAIQNFDEGIGKDFGSFAKVCVRRHMIDAVRKSTGKKHRALNDYVPMNGYVDDDEKKSAAIEFNNVSNINNPESIILSMESIEQISELISKELTPLEEKVIKLYLTGNSYDEISKKIGKNYKSIDNAVQRARKKLEKKL